jgi:cytochrome P450
MDGDEHRAHRIIVNDWFKPRNVRKMQERVDELAKQYIDQMQALGPECDFAKEIATHFPLQVILSILGLPESDYEKMLKLTQELFGAEDPDIGRAGEDASVLTVMMEFFAYFTQLAADRRANPTDDLASVIANAELDGAPLPDMDVFGFYLIISTAGHDTTSNSIAGGLLGLIEHPDQLALLREHPEIIENAANELIRYVSPVKHFIRTCQATTTVGGVTFEPGDVVLLSYASANRDEAVFPDPFALDLRRENAGSHLAFGFGPHFCLGAHLARMEVRSLFKELVGRLDTVELVSEPTFVQSRLVSGPKTLPVRYTWR